MAAMAYKPGRKLTIRGVDNKNSGEILVSQVVGASAVAGDLGEYVTFIYTTGGATIYDMRFSAREGAYNRAKAIMRFVEGDDTPTDAGDDDAGE
jgi:hypothetical protein